MHILRFAAQHMLLSLSLLQVHARTRCYTCVNARSNEECNQMGEIKVCSPSEQSCQNEVRLNFPNGFGYLITKRCKQTLACRNVQNQNKKPAWMPTQCNMEFKKNSVCQCCCSGDLCNAQELPCSDAKSCPQRGALKNGRVTCSDYNFLGSKCRYHCNSGYAVGGPKVIECISNGQDLVWDDKEPVCAATPCRSSIQPPTHGVMSCTNNFAIGSVCSFRCSSGYQMEGPRRIMCNSNGEWAHQPPKCERIRCDGQEAPSFGSMRCSSGNQYASICEFSCDQGYHMRGESVSTCQMNGQWSTPIPTCQRVICHDLPNDFRNGVRTCTDGSFFESTCTYSCSRGYYLRGPVSTSCLEDTKWSRSEPTCERVYCAARPKIPENGEMQCSEGSEFGSVCQFVCKDGFMLIGSTQTSCLENGEWSNEIPECKKIACNQSHDSIENGEVECTDGTEYASKCNFMCNDGFRLVGPDILTCESNLLWSSPAPFCVGQTCTGQLRTPPNTKLECSDGNKSFSRCSYICGDGSERWESTGEMTAVCQKNEVQDIFQWSISEPPCCARRCPPFAKVDLFVVLDSSSSVGQENWNKTLQFVSDILENFNISPEDLLIGLIRYNREVDEENEIRIGQYSTKEATLNAIFNMPYNGQGTNTGNAINYVVNHMITREGNRPDVDDMVLLITDGRSRDDLKVPSSKLRDTGADIVVLGISNREGSLTKEDLLDVTDDPEKTIVSTTGFDGISSELIQAFISRICKNPCTAEGKV